MNPIKLELQDRIAKLEKGLLAINSISALAIILKNLNKAKEELMALEGDTGPLTQVEISSELKKLHRQRSHFRNLLNGDSDFYRKVIKKALLKAEVQIAELEGAASSPSTTFPTPELEKLYEIRERFNKELNKDINEDLKALKTGLLRIEARITEIESVGGASPSPLPD
jgi:hypothetical protein